MGKDPESRVEVHLAGKLKAAGFSGRGRRLSKKVAECSVELEVQRSRFGRSQHFVNVQVTYDPWVCAREKVREGAGILCRAESINPAEKDALLEALDDEAVMTEEERVARLDRLVDAVLLPFLDAVSTVGGARELYVKNKLDQMAFAALKERWEQSA